MCLATVYVEEDGAERELAREVAWLHFDREGVVLGQFMGGEQRLPMRLKSVDLLQGAVVLTPAAVDETDLLGRA